MSYYINQTNPADDGSSDQGVPPAGKVYNEEEFMDEVFKGCSHLGRDKFDQIMADMKAVVTKLMEEKGVDELPFKKLPGGATASFVKPDMTPKPPDNQ